MGWNKVEWGEVWGEVRWGDLGWGEGWAGSHDGWLGHRHRVAHLSWDGHILTHLLGHFPCLLYLLVLQEM